MTAGLRRWFGRPELEVTGLRWARPASHMQRGVARSGLFYMTEQSLGFVPRRIDALLGARAVSWELASLAGVRLKPTLRKLRVTVSHGSGRDRFIVSDALVVLRDLQSLQPH